MNRAELITEIQRKKSFLCIGLDTDLEKIPAHLLDEEDPLFSFNKAIIDATHKYAVAFKPNIAFYEAYGLKGWQSLEKTIHYLKKEYPEIFTIADAKRGDIGNTSGRYARAFLKQLNFDSITVNPYMGADSVKPFLEIKDKWAIILALTSNEGASDFQTSRLHEQQGSEMVFEKVLKLSSEWGSRDNIMYVIGATRADYLQKVRQIIPGHFLLIPGIGAQGGSLEEVVEAGLGMEPNLLINASRSIIYASSGADFEKKAALAAENLQNSMSVYL